MHIALESSEILWNNEVKPVKVHIPLELVFCLVSQLKTSQELRRKEVPIQLNHIEFSLTFFHHYTLWLFPCNCFNWMIFRVSQFGTWLVPRQSVLHNKYRNKNETAFNPKNFKNLHFPTFKVLINTFILLLTIPVRNRPNSFFCSLWAGWQSMKSSCNRCGFFETI